MRSAMVRLLKRVARVCGFLLALSLAIERAAMGDRADNGDGKAAQGQSQTVEEMVAVASPNASDTPRKAPGAAPVPIIEDLADLGLAVGTAGLDRALDSVDGIAELFFGIADRVANAPKNPWLNKTVVLKSLRTRLRVNGKVVPMSGGGDFHRFTVKKIENDDRGDRLWIVDEVLGPQGWVRATEVVLEDDAPAYFTQVIEREPRSAQAYYQRGSLDDNEQAISDLTEATRLDPRFTTARLALSHAYSKQKDYARAIAELTEAIEVDSNLAEAYCERASLYCQTKDTERASADYTEAIRINPASFMAYGGRGMVHFGKKAWDRAVVDLTEALRHAPQEENAALSFLVLAPYHFNRGIAYDNQEQYDLAIADFIKAGELAGPFSPLSDEIIIAGVYRCAFRLVLEGGIGPCDQCLHRCDQAVTECEVRNPWGMRAVRTPRNRAKDVAGALADCDRACEVEPKSPWGHDYRAWIKATNPEAKFRDGKRAVRRKRPSPAS